MKKSGNGKSRWWLPWRAILAYCLHQCSSIPRGRVARASWLAFHTSWARSLARLDVDTLLVVVKRMQLFRVGGRRALRATSFSAQLASSRATPSDPERALRLLRLSLPRFRSRPGRSEGANLGVDRPLSARDRSPRRLRRKAVLDHIFPVYLAGDRLDNLQVLCQTCNSGKSDDILGFEGTGLVWRRSR